MHKVQKQVLGVRVRGVLRLAPQLCPHRRARVPRPRLLVVMVTMMRRRWLAAATEVEAEIERLQPPEGAPRAEAPGLTVDSLRP
eukprot:4968793-Prymnesium_polylepis.1